MDMSREARERRLKERMVEVPGIRPGVETPCIALKGWDKRKDPTDYMSFPVEGKSAYAHRVAWAYLHMDITYLHFKALEKGIGEPMEVHHLCDLHPCVNVEHLMWIDQPSNREDGSHRRAAKIRAKRAA
jgi:hypothetical protein